jgi:hypothetical protein
MKILGREPAAWAGLASIIVSGIGAFWAGFDTDTQAWTMAVVTAVLGLIVAVMVHDGVIAAIAGFVQAVVSLAVGLGADLSTARQFAIMTIVTGLAQFATRQSVGAPVPPLPPLTARSRPPAGV